jgi:hypothetical protein
MIGGFIRAIGAGKEAKRLQQQADALNPVRPTYQIPEEIQKMLESAYTQAQGDMPGYGRTIGQIQGATANQLAQARNYADSGTSMLQNLALAGEGQRNAMLDLNMQNAQFRGSNVNALQQALMNMAGFQQEKFQFNEVEPYMQQEADKRAFQEAAQNQRMAKRDAWASFADGIVNTGLAIGTAGVGGGQTLFGKLFGGKGAGAVAEGVGGAVSENITDRAIGSATKNYLSSKGIAGQLDFKPTQKSYSFAPFKPSGS